MVAWYLKLPKVRTKKSYRKDCERSQDLLRHFGDVKADKIKPSMVESFQHQMLETKSRYGRPYLPGTINRMTALMKRIYNLAIREDMVIKNPCWKVPMLPENNKRDRILSPEELNQLVPELPPHQVPIVVVGYYTGMRLGEILGLVWDRVTLGAGHEDSHIDLKAEDTKTSEPRRVHFHPEVWAVFVKANKVRSLVHDHVFTFRGRPVRDIRNGFARACERVGIEDFHFHDLRHTCVTNMRKAGIDTTVIMKMTGHKTPAMFHRYNTVDQDDAQEAMAILTDYLAKETRVA